ncbi:helix-turn-helix domain-containing protein [Amycolatopsis nigrescens]|uniref:helix-turn-helix domain-containing protein n=1 Tax=Amycolatopsis nigrescens TaxID=381445 RepID=UPI00039DC308|nr:helix-turn-helix transcriptional regulator [Amycolatopsis nigrescens]
MSRAHWKPLADDLPHANRELAARLRALLDRRGLSLRQLAADEDVHHSLTALHRFFAGQAVPRRQLLELLSRRCDGDLYELYELRERALRGSSAPPGAALREPAAQVQHPARAGWLTRLGRRTGDPSGR